ncbi:hypothetical protein D5085_02240 [Ectothiorhodospiraceae bacterium BW-2]|nr:hypothetical protein D5085_00760 [Ectothiorhodospiraceae bacterium BW-2]QEP42063.1 hypothetical protein D5085_02240 [Ectothiorhodospiraceae bacterium BW-2]
MPNPTLAAVSQAFKDWRENPEKSARSRIPEALQQQTVALIGHYPVSHILKALRINYRQLSSWKKSREENDTIPGFIALEPSEPTSEPLLALKWTTETTTGRPLSVEGELSPEQWRQLLPLLSQMGANS